MHQLFVDNRWTDMLPIILPTEERVVAMLEGTSRSPDTVVGHMRPTSTREAWQYTVEKVAVNAVMAGARPEYFPVILALAATCSSARASTTSSAASMAVVNGPVRHEIGMNWGIGAMGPYNHANATIGRAYGLLSQNLQGGSLPEVTYLGSQGNNYAYNSVTFAENEERSPWGALPRAARLRTGPERGQRLRRLPFNCVQPGSAGEALAGPRAQYAARSQPAQPADAGARSDHGAAVH